MVTTAWKGVFREDLLRARLCTGALGYIGEQRRQRFLLSWNLYSSRGRETINVIVSCVYVRRLLKIWKEGKVEQVKGIRIARVGWGAGWGIYEDGRGTPH